jgi:hypothetical protein
MSSASTFSIPLGRKLRKQLANWPCGSGHEMKFSASRVKNHTDTSSSTELQQPRYVKVKLSCAYLIKHYVMKTYGRLDVEIHMFLTSPLIGVEWSASLRGRFTPGERSQGIRWTGDWVGPRIGLDAIKRRKLPGPTGTRTPTRRPSSKSLYRLCCTSKFTLNHDVRKLYSQLSIHL